MKIIRPRNQENKLIFPNLILKTLAVSLLIGSGPQTNFEKEKKTFLENLF